MKRTVALVLVAVLPVGMAYAGENVVPKTKAGDKALLFSLYGLSDLGAGNFNGGIGGKYYVANRLAVRLSLGLRSSTTTSNNPLSPVPAGEKGEREATSTSFTGYVGGLYSVATTGSVNAYVGATVGYSIENISADGINGDGFDADSKWESSFAGVTAGAVLGVEWFPWESISVGAEYALSFTSYSGEGTRTTDGASAKSGENSLTAFTASSANSASLTVSVYF